MKVGCGCGMYYYVVHLGCQAAYRLRRAEKTLCFRKYPVLEQAG